MITLKMGEILELLPSAKALLATKLPGTPQYRLSRFVDKVSSELRVFEKERLDLIKELGTPTEDGNGYEIKDEAKLEEFKTKIAELLDEEVKIDLAPLTEQMFEKAEVVGDHLFGIRKLLI